MSKLALGIDMGGTGIKLGLVDSKGNLYKNSRLPTPLNSTPEQVIAMVSDQAEALMKAVGRKQILGIGVGCAGDVDPEHGVIRISPNLKWKHVPLKALLSKRLKHSILVDNDANVAAWAAYSVEAKR